MIEAMTVTSRDLVILTDFTFNLSLILKLEHYRSSLVNDFCFSLFV